MKAIHFLLVSILALAAVSATRAADVTDVLAPGTNLSFEASADGTPGPTFEWFRNGTKIGEGAKLVVGPLTAETAGSYTVKATNALGSAISDKYTVLMGTPPSKPTIKLVVTVTVSATVGAGTTNSSTGTSN